MTDPIQGDARTPGPLGAVGGVGAQVRGPIGTAFHDARQWVLSVGAGTFSGSIANFCLPVGLARAFNGMDDQGQTILGTYLYGGGVDHDIEDESWTEYMMAHPTLSATLIVRLREYLRKLVAAGNAFPMSGMNVMRVTNPDDNLPPVTSPISDRFHFEFPENSDFSGYAFLHGSNAKVGDFLMAGSAEFHEVGEQAYDVDMALRFTFNDIVDPNENYGMDSFRNIFANIVTIGGSKKYRLSINWGSKCKATIRPNQEIGLMGYPSRLPYPGGS